MKDGGDDPDVTHGNDVETMVTLDVRKLRFQELALVSVRLQNPVLPCPLDNRPLIRALER